MIWPTLALDGGYGLRTGLGVSLAKPEDNDAFSLALVIEYEAAVAKWLLTQRGNIFNDLEGVINDDQSAWLDGQPEGFGSAPSVIDLALLVVQLFPFQAGREFATS